MKNKFFTFAAIALAFASILATTAPKSLVSMNDDDDDELALTLVFNTLMNVERAEEALDVALTMDEAASEVLVFGMKSQVEMHVSLSLTDINTQEVFANREFDIIPGANYRALNVSSIPAGQYALTISQNGRSAKRFIEIVRND